MVRRIAATPIQLTLDGSYVCLHALSSFQRTGTRRSRCLPERLNAVPCL